jgi:type II secretory pathway component PulK
MKTGSSIARGPRKSQDGSAVLIVLVLLLIMVMLAAANTVTLNKLRQRVKLVDQRQTARLASYSTNAFHAAASVPSRPDSK